MRARAGILLTFSGGFAHRAACKFLILWDPPHFLTVSKVRPEYDPSYIAAFLNSKLGSLQLKRLAIGSILEHITKDDLKAVEIVFPTDDTKTDAIAKRFAQSTAYRELARQEMDEANKDIINALAGH